LLSRLLTVAGYCVRVRVKPGSSIFDSYSHWMPSMSRNTAEETDETLGLATYALSLLALSTHRYPRSQNQSLRLPGSSSVGIGSGIGTMVQKGPSCSCF
jgi:hypothetical protein